MEKLKLNFTGSVDEIIKVVDDYKENLVPEIETRKEYAKGNNTFILNRIIPPNAPNNKAPVSYARRMINLVTSYMYKPGLINYTSDKNERYLDELLEVFAYNDEPLQSEQMGRQTSIQGIGYELFFNEGLEQVQTYGGVGYKEIMPRFVKIPIESTIPIYNYDIIPRLTHFIRFYTIEEEETEYINVYDETTKRAYRRMKDREGLTLDDEEKHGFSRPPIVVYENNEDMIGDFSCVVPLINAYDVLLSDSLNEFDRFAWAYLVMKGFSLTDEDAENIKHRRAFSLLNKDDMVEFLTKPINHEFIKFMSEWVRGEIHRQSGIPNLDDYKFGGQASGETLSKWIYLMELFTDPKQSYFEKALKERIDIVTEYKGLSGDPDEIEIVMSRNSPDKSMDQAELMEKYAGHVTEKTLLENFADFIKDAQAEIDALAEEKSAYRNIYDSETEDSFGGEGDNAAIPDDSREDQG